MFGDHVTIKIIDEINAWIIGLSDRDIKYFYDKFGIFEKGYFFNPYFKLGPWDGKTHFFSKTGKTYVQLLPEIVPDLKKFGIKMTLVDMRKYHPIDIPKIDKNFLSNYENPKRPGQPLILGDHQVDAVNIATELNMGIIRGGTGAGKSIICACLLRLYYEYQKYKCLVIVPSKNLVVQTSEDLAAYGNDVGMYYSNVKDVNRTHVVSTWQSLQNNMKLASMFDAIIVDECHGAKAKIIREILNDHAPNAAVKLGLTGTIPDDPCDATHVRVALGEIIYEIPVHELIASGWLATLKLKMIQLVEDFMDKWQEFQIQYPDKVKKKKLTYGKFKDEYFPDWKSEKAYLENHEKRNNYIVNMVEAACKTRGNCLVLAAGISYGKRLAKMIPDAYFIYGKDKDAVRKKIFKLFSENDNIILITSYQIGSTGLDISRIFNLFLIDAGRSFVSIIQSIGRGLRKASDKDTIYVYDIGSDLKSSKKHVVERKSHFTKEKYEFTFEKIDYMIDS